jgi:hypothetical protein
MTNSLPRDQTKNKSYIEYKEDRKRENENKDTEYPTDAL